MILLPGGAAQLLLNPRLPDDDRRRFEQLFAAAPPLPEHLWLPTSGTTGGLKLTALSHHALRASAAAVNAHLRATASDVWASVLPTFHVGGLGIAIRASLSGARVVEAPWSADGFAALCAREGATLSALVPAQLRDLVQAALRAPASLRAIVIGGGALAPELYAEARALGWNALPSYGMTEACSQIATASLESLDAAALPLPELLPHLEARVGEDGRLAFRGTALFSGYLLFDEHEGPRFVDPKRDGWFVSDDTGRIVIRAGTTLLDVEGRRGDFVKIGGESVDLRRLDRLLESILHEARAPFDAALFARTDARLGHVIALAATGHADAIVEADAVVEAFNARVAPFERIREVRRVTAIPRTALGKLVRSALGG